MITGGGANTLVRVTPEGLIVVDTKNPGDENYNRVMEEIRSVSSLPVKYVLNTHHHPDHVGTNQKFIDAGGCRGLQEDVGAGGVAGVRCRAGVDGGQQIGAGSDQVHGQPLMQLSATVRKRFTASNALANSPLPARLME